VTQTTLSIDDTRSIIATTDCGFRDMQISDVSGRNIRKPRSSAGDDAACVVDAKRGLRHVSNGSVSSQVKLTHGFRRGHEINRGFYLSIVPSTSGWPG